MKQTYSIKAALTACLVVIAARGDAQLSVTPQTDLQELARAISGPGVQIANPVIACHTQGYGQFSYTGNLLGIEEGVLLTTGRITNAVGPNNVENRSYEQSMPGNALLNSVTGRTTYDACRFEFDIIPGGDSLRFNFVMGSEEYNEWVGSQYNDVFGFFISGPGITGDPGIGNEHNIALIPGTTQAVTINNVNNGSNQAYYHDNVGGQQIQYDGFTVGLKAEAAVQPCQTYRLKLIVADASDRKFDTGVFIERIESNSVVMSTLTASGFPNMVEGCNNGMLRFTRQNVTADPLVVPYFLMGTAINGVDYPLIGDDPDPMVAKTVTIPGNQASVDVLIEPIVDGQAEGDEYIRIYLGTSVCPGVYIDSLDFFIQDSLHATVNAPATICAGGSTPLLATGGIDYAWSPAAGLNSTIIAGPLAAPNTSSNYTVTVTAGDCSATLNTSVTVSNMTLTSTITRPLCHGGGNGAINLTVANGIAPYNFAWAGPGGFTAATEDLVNVAAGTFTVTVTDASGCTRVQSFNVTTPAALAITTTPSVFPFGQNIACSGASTGSIGLGITGGTGPYTISWSGPNGFASTAQHINGLAAGTYVVQVTDANGCTASGSRTLTDPEPLVSVIDDLDHVDCSGNANGSATVTTTGGMPPFTYAWNSAPAQTDATASGLEPGTYTVTVTDAYGCTNTAQAVINGPASGLQVSIDPVHVACHGDASGSAAANVSGGTAPFTYAWNTTPAQTGATATDLPVGAVEVTVTDANGCTAMAAITINGPASALQAVISNVTHVQCGGSTGGAVVSAAGGTGAYDYSWNSVPVQHGAALSNVPAGDYTATVTDANGCSQQVSVTIDAPTEALSVSIASISSVACFNGGTGSATAEVSGGEAPYTYVWNTTPQQEQATATGLQAGTYMVTVTDASGCTASATATIEGPAAPLSVSITAFTNVLCFDQEEGTATAAATGGTAPYTYAWNTVPAQTGAHATDLDEGMYLVTVTDANNCTASTSVQISGPTFGIVALIETYNDVTCYGGNDGSATMTITGGGGSYTVTWDTQPPQTGLTVSGLAPGIYTAEVIDNNGCDTPKFIPLTISGPPEPLVLDLDLSNYNGFEVSCADGADGTIDLTVTGGMPSYYIVWSDDFGNSTGIEDLSNLDPGAYHLTVTDANGCVADTTVVMEAPPAITITAEVTTASCQGSASGAIEATIAGGLAPHTITWSGPNGFSANTTDINDLEAGIYSLAVTDANGCTVARTYDVSEPGVFDVQAVISSYNGGWNVSCVGATDGSIDVTVTGGTGPYTFEWTLPGGTTSSNEDLTGIGAGTYSLSVTDVNGCSVLSTHTLTAPTPITVQLAPSLMNGYNIFCNGVPDGHIEAAVSGGTQFLTFSWSGPDGFVAETQNIYNLGPGTYTLTVTDANGCIRTASTTLVEPPYLDVSYTISTSPSGDAVACADVPSGTIDVTITGGVSPITVAWTGPDGFTSTATDLLGLAPGTYTLTVADANNCIDYHNIILTSPAPIAAGGIVLDHHGMGVSCAGASDGAIDGQVIGGTGGYTYSWSGPNGFASNDEDITGLAPGTYHLTATDSNGCNAYDTFYIIAPQPLSATAVANNPIGCTGDTDGSIDLDIQGGTEPYAVTWSGPDGFTSNDEDISGLGAGTYTAAIVDANGCTASAQFTLNDPQPLAIDLDPVVYNGGHNVSCAGAADGAIDLTINGGTAPFTILWTDQLGFTSGDEDISGLPAGLYFVTVTDANGCTANAQIMLGTPDPVVLSAVLSDINGHNVSCDGASDGAIDLTVDGGTAPYTYDWSNNAGTEDLANITAGTYTVTVTDANGCTATATYTLDAPETVTSSLEAALLPGGYNVSCADGSDGSIDATLQGGVQPYIIAWAGPNGFTSADEDISGLAAGTYTLTVTDDNGCTHTASIVVTAPPAIDIDLAATVLNGGYHIGCFGEAEGMISAAVNGGIGDLTLAWSGPNGFTSTEANISALVAGTYTLTVTDANACTASSSINLEEPQPLDVQYTLSDHSGFNVSCAGDDGAITLAITGGTPAHAISWTGPNGFGSTQQDLTALAAGNYHLVVTDANGCLFETNVLLTTPAPLEASFTYVANLCPDDANGSIDLTVAGGAGPFTYVWNGPGSFTSADEDISGLVTGTYTVEVSDPLGCTRTFTAALVGPAPLGSGTYVSFYGLHNLQCHGDSTGVIELAPQGGTAPYTIQVNGPNGFNSSAVSHTGLVAGTYDVSIIDANGCPMDTTITLTEPATLMDATFTLSVYPSGTNVSCYGASDGWIDATITGGTGPYSFFWRGPDSLEFNTEDIFGLSAGDYAYELVVTDTNQCSFFTEITLTQPDTAIHANTVLTMYGDYHVSCADATNGAIDLTANGGNGGFTYAWTGPGGFASTDEDISGLGGGTYTVTITDMNGCTHDETVTIAAPEPLVNDLQVTTFPGGTTISCHGANDGSITANASGGAGGYTFSWTGPNGFTSSDAAINGLAPGTYCLTITDANGCTAESCADIAEPVALAANVAAQIASCGDDNGAADLTVSGGTAPFSYNWSNNATSEDINGLAPGTYTVTVTDANGCTASAQAEVVGTPIVTAEAATNNNLCNGGNEGAIDLSVTSGSAPYTYAWSNGATTEDIGGLAAGTYTVTVTDDNGCSFNASYTVTEASALVIDTTLSQHVGGYHVSTWQGSDGSIALHVSGGTAPYTYAWSNGATTASQYGLPAGEYVVTVTDANGCSTSLLIILTQPEDLIMPTGFTPNGDGANDTFVIRGLDAYPANTLVILNRWGNVVYDRLNYRNDWTGENTQGQQLPNGTYFAILKVDEGARTLQGYVDLRR